MTSFRRFLRMALLCFCAGIAIASELDATKDFNRAKNLIEAGHENQALVSFSDFLRRYPSHILAADAQFYLGEIYLQRRNFNEALKEYRRVYDLKLKTNPRIADAGMRIGECLFKLGQNVEATIELQAVLRKFPKSEAAKKAEILLASVQAAGSKNP